ncbi:MAG: sigma-70 family RNA polymerase sigma factor [Propionibacterium sp.]|nr:sigma-70 family RNA polymerase sigma factor [Propionibacterium sp.]
MSYSQLRREALAIVNSPDPLPVSAWADAVRAVAARLRELGVDDRVIGTALWTTGAVTGMSQQSKASPGTTTDRLMVTLRDLTERDLAQDPQGLRSAVALITHAAARGLPWEAPARTLLGVLERGLLTGDGLRPLHPPLDEALRHWQAALSVAGPALSHPHVAVSVAAMQTRLLDLTRRTLDRVTSAEDGVSTARFEAAVVGATAAWSAARREWARDATLPAETSAGEVEGVMRAVSLAASELGRAAGTQALEDPVQLLRTLAVAEFGGHVMAATMAATVRPGDQTAQTLLAASARLAAAGDVLDINALRAESPNAQPPGLSRVDAEGRTSSDARDQHPSAAVTSTAGGGEPRPLPRAVDVPERGMLSPTEAAELARRRDVGVLAATALSGVEEARRITRHVSGHELESLMRQGAEAKAEMLASVVGLIRSRGRRWPGMSDERREEMNQQVAVQVAGAAGRWNPETGVPWPAYAAVTANFASRNFFDAENKDGRYVPDDELDDRPSRQVGVEDDALDRVLVSRVGRIIDDMAEPQRTAVRMYLGLQGQAQGSGAAVAKELGLPVESGRARIRDGLAALKAMLNDPAPTDGPSFHPHEQTQRNQPRRPGRGL